MSRLLLLTNTTGYQAKAFRDAAQKMGISLALATDRCHVLEDPWQDGAIAVRFQEPEESARSILDFARHNPVDGITAIGDAPTVTAAHAAAALGLLYHPVSAVAACRDKWLAREHCRAAGLLVPDYKRFPANQKAELAADSIPYPCVLKPLGLSGSRGVIRVNETNQFIAAFRRIRNLLETPEVQALRETTSSWIQVESYIPGAEVAVEGLITEGRLRVLAIFDKPDPLEGPYFEETIYVTPSRLPRTTQNEIYEIMQRAVTALGLTHGPLHAELRINDDGLWILEAAARPIGGLCSRALRFENWMSLEELIMRHALGEPVEHLPRESQSAGVMMIPIPQSGFYEGVENQDKARRILGVEGIEITAKLRQKLVPLPEGSSYLGFIFARGASPEVVENILRRAHSELHFKISTDIPVV